MSKLFQSILLFLVFMFSVISFADTKILDLKSNKSVYQVGENPILQAVFNSKPDSIDFQFDLISTLNGAPLTVTRVTDFQMFASPKDLAVGSYTWAVTVVIQDAAYAKDLKSTIEYYQNIVFYIDEHLETETDPDVISSLQKRKSDCEQIIAASESELARIRSVVSEPITLQFAVQ